MKFVVKPHTLPQNDFMKTRVSIFLLVDCMGKWVLGIVLRLVLCLAAPVRPAIAPSGGDNAAGRKNPLCGGEIRIPITLMTGEKLRHNKGGKKSL